MNLNKLLSYGAIVILYSFIITVYVWVFLPKPHIGYYFQTCDGINSSQVYPVYRIINNWKYYPDTMAFESFDKDITLQVFSSLNNYKK